MDKYVRVKQIGEGSFGKALLVKSKENGKQFVVKEINMAKMSRKERDDARKETAVLAQLHHPNIVMYRESFEEIGHLYIVMDYCDGGDLYARINMQRGILFPEDMILDWFVQTCLAVKHIHDRKILHRDIKSQNIFLTRHGIVKLGDFGIAKVLNSTVELARSCIGTPYYLSPEICENKPYNNKSDIWSLGCVLYEITTLKHAFESGNMKNLVLKIIRGSYPPPSPRYSYELRNLIAAVFRRNARDRPSITSVLRKPILQTRIRKFLSESEVDDEFSHTVMHGKKIQKVLTPGARVFAQPPRPVPAKKTPVRATPLYDPASVYAPSVARRSKENDRRSVEVRKSSGEKRPSSAGASTPDLVKRRKELVVKERKRREEEAKRKEQLYMRQHRDIIEKQRVARMMKAREEGWKHLRSSQESTDSDKVMKEEPRRPAAVASPKPAVPLRERGNYEAYHAWLDKQEEERRSPADPPRLAPRLGVAGALGYQDSPSPSPSPALGGAIPSAQMAAKQGEQAGAKGAEAAERAKILQEYQLRKHQAAAYKARGQGNVFGGAAAPVPRRAPPAPKPSAGRPSSSNSANQPTPASSREGESEQDYLARLRQIRLQNFNERRVQKVKQEAKADAAYKPSVIDHGNELRRKKIDALRVQAEDRANKLRADLEKRRREAYDNEQRRHKQESALGRDVNKAQRPPLPVKPARVIPLTEAMNAISASKVEPKKSDTPLKPAVGMTAAMQAIGASDTPPASPDKLCSGSPLQKQKAEILKRLNAKPPWAPKQERPKWGEPVDKPAVERPHWNSGKQSTFSQLPLEETASHMEATNPGDLVVMNPMNASVATGNDQKEADRKHWGAPGGTVLNVLQSAQLTDTTSSDMSEIGPVEGAAEADRTKVAGGQDSSSESKKEPHQTKAPVIGSTFTVKRSPLRGISLIQKTSPKKDQTDAPVTVNAATESPSALIPPEHNLDRDIPLSSSHQDGSAGEVEDKAEEEKEDKDSVIEGTSQVTPQQLTTDTAEEASALFEKVNLNPDAKEASVRNTEDIKVEDIGDIAVKEDEEDEKSKVEDVTETTLTKDETENSDTDNMAASEKIEEKDEDEMAAISNVRVKTLSGGTAGVILGLTMGHFDAAINLLRTCSEPDLCKLSLADTEADITSSVSEAALHDIGSDPTLTGVSSLDEGTDDRKGKGRNDGNGSSEPADSKSSDGEAGSLGGEGKSHSETEKERENVEEKDEDETEAGTVEAGEGGGGDTGGGGGGDTGERGGGDEAEDEGSSRSTEDDDDDDDELDTVRASMLLVLEGATASDEDDEPLTARSSTKKMKEKKTKVKKSNAKPKASETADNSVNRKWSASSMADLCSIRETMKDLLQPRPCEGPKKRLPPVPDAGQGDADQPDAAASAVFNVGESWQSDGDDDDYFEEDDMFSRLEESRVRLEKELGCEVFLNAYKTVQAIHEDEDENIEEGVRLISKILGAEKEHLYPSILQLVMADGVFTEDND